MGTTKMITLVTAFLLFHSTLALNVGDSAPKFSLEGSPKGASLDELKGKYVVLEWYNDGCPFVRKHYDSKNMQNLQKKYSDKVAWLTINSSAEGRQGYLANMVEAKSKYTKEQMASLSLLLDSPGKVGRAYAAKTTPHMYVIDPAGKLVYQGAIDSTPSANPDDIATSTNYVSQALDEVLAGKKVSVAKTQAYGCSVKY
jgi:peroxiredoxin